MFLILRCSRSAHLKCDYVGLFIALLSQALLDLTLFISRSTPEDILNISLWPSDLYLSLSLSLFLYTAAPDSLRMQPWPFGLWPFALAALSTQPHRDPQRPQGCDKHTAQKRSSLLRHASSPGQALHFTLTTPSLQPGITRTKFTIGPAFNQSALTTMGLLYFLLLN